MSSTSSLALVQQYLIRYGMTSYLILGNIGLICNTIIFSQRELRHKSTSIYILAASICSFLGLNISVIPNIYAVYYSSSFTSYIVYCRVQFFFRHAWNEMMRTFFVLICIDRCAACSNRVSFRAFNQFKVAISIIPCVVLFWFLLSVFPTMLLSVDTGACEASNTLDIIMFSIYIIVTLGIFPLVGMTICALIFIINLKQMRTRIRPTTRNSIIALHVFRKRDRDIIKMLLVEIGVYTCTTIPVTLTLIYNLTTYTSIKDGKRLQIEGFINFLTRVFLLYVNNTTSFWIYILTSSTFRMEFRKLIIKWYRFISIKLNRIF